MKRGLTDFSIHHPWLVIGIAVIITAFFATQFPNIKIDTDPEHMLSPDEPVLAFEHQTKIDFDLSDFIAVGIINEEGAFNPQTLNRVYNITAEIEEIEGVVVDDIMAPSTVDDIKQGDGGGLIIAPLMEDEIETQEQADYIFQRIKQNPVLRGKLASDDGKAMALFIPIESKDQSARIAGQIEHLTKEYGGDVKYHIAGLPVAEDSFGSQMFAQMAYAAPATFVVIFLLLFSFFRNFKIIVAPMVVAVMSVIWTMGLLIMTGNTVHIMSSMIPIFLIPIAVINSIYIISEFHGHFTKHQQKNAAIRHSISELFVPMLFVSLVAAVGFLALAITPIPPVQVFGVFIGFGTMVSWLLSITINPAFATLISTKTLHRFAESDESQGFLSRILHLIRDFSGKHRGGIIVGALVMVVISAVGLSLIVVNDNPVKWFKKSHPIRQADIAMNAHLAGTYMNYLVFEGIDDDDMKRPEVERYIEDIQKDLEEDITVGAAIGLPDIIKKVRYELFGADSSKMVLPTSQDEIAQMLFIFEMSGGDPDDLFKFVTPNYDKANVWVQLKNGDNRAVSHVVDRANDYMARHPLPMGIKAQWAGLPYINIVWQNLMVGGMREALLLAFLVVLIMMTSLFRSIKWGIISMLPLTITIMAIYAFIGFIGKPYDMPVAVLSTLTLGLSVDFAIQFIQRLRTAYRRTQDFQQALHDNFEGVGRAIMRNVLIISIGFVPMLFSSLVPYITVGAFFLAIELVSGLVTMFLLPAIARVFQKGLFPKPITKGEN
ncbi:MAG: MMPL family transporter [candidate division Zixibacteria bacterium]|nr:MMPL family transporter [candidate division Zixibacteria bacterium]